jgi:hypothetical protein
LCAALRAGTTQDHADQTPQELEYVAREDSTMNKNALGAVRARAH